MLFRQELVTSAYVAPLKEKPGERGASNRASASLRTLARELPSNRAGGFNPGLAAAVPFVVIAATRFIARCAAIAN